MSRVSHDPSWWPLIDFAFNYSYCVGPLKAVQIILAMLSLNHFTVAFSVVVVYDWGEPDHSIYTRELLVYLLYPPSPVLTSGQEVCRWHYWSSLLVKTVL
jgi:hypothetical protein